MKILQPTWPHLQDHHHSVQKGIARIFYYKDGSTSPECLPLKINHCPGRKLVLPQRPSQKGVQMVQKRRQSSPLMQPDFSPHTINIRRLSDSFAKIFEQGYVETVNRLESLQFYNAEESLTPDSLEEMPELIAAGAA